MPSLIVDRTHPAPVRAVLQKNCDRFVLDYDGVFVPVGQVRLLEADEACATTETGPEHYKCFRHEVRE